MCVIVSKEKDKNLPSMDDLKNCFERNDDGAGFLYTDNGRVVIDKGYMTYKAFKKRFKKLCKKYDNFNNKALILHFRIGTSGSNSRENCHPYPLSSKNELLKKTYIKSDLGVVHNGIITDYIPINGEDINDTQEFIIKYLTPLYNNYKDFYKNDYILKGIETITNSKFAILDKNDDIYYIGDFIEHDGVKYSNASFESYQSYFKSQFDWSDYDRRPYSLSDWEKEQEETQKGYFDDIDDADVFHPVGELIELKKGYFIEYGDNWEQIREDGAYYYDIDNNQLLDCNYNVLQDGVIAFNQDYEEIY